MRSTNHPRYKTHAHRSILMLIVLFALLTNGCSAGAPKVYRIGVLSGLDAQAAIADGFKAKMTDLGYTEGQTITYDIQKANGDTSAFKRILQKFVDEKVDLILVFPT